MSLVLRTAFATLCLSGTAFAANTNGSLDAATKFKTSAAYRLAVLRDAIDPLESKKPASDVQHIVLTMVGDTGFAPSGAKPHANVVYKYGRKQTFAQATSKIRAQINGDINFANIEAVISAKRLRAMPKKYNFVTHPNGARHLVDIGFNLFSMANNHSFDYRAEGVRHSVKHADSLLNHGLLAHAGIGFNRKQAAHAPTFTVKDTDFAFGAIGIGAGGGGIQRATAKRPGQLNLNNRKDVGLLMKNLQQAKAQYRILSVHRGWERIIRPSKNELHSVRNTMLEQGNVDLMIGHHAHVARGIEITNGRLVLWGLGNFVHQGTANMAGKGGCRDYSLLARVHLVKRGDEKPQLAAVEVLPIAKTHMQTVQMSPRQGAKRIAVLNGLAAQFDNAGSGSRGVRFVPQTDGTGLYCQSGADLHPDTARLCGNYSPTQLASAATYRRAVNSCGRTANPVLVARGTEPAKRRNRVVVKLEPKTIPAPKPSVRPTVPDPKVVKLDKTKIPRQQPNGAPPAVIAKANETYAEKRARWSRKEYTQEEIDAYKARIAKKRSKNASVTQVAATATRTKSRRVSLTRANLNRMSKAQRKKYWTRVWYQKRGRKIPSHLR